MKSHLKEAIKIVNSNLVLVTVIAISGIYTAGGDGSVIHYLVALVVMVVTNTAVLGRLSKSLTDERRISYAKLIKKYWITYLKVYLIFFILLLLFPLVRGIDIDPVAGSIVMVALSVCISILAIYITPYVFLENKALLSFDKGIRFLMQNFVYSLPLIFMTLLLYPFKALVTFGRPLLDYHLQPSVASFILYVLVISFILNFFHAYINLVIFTAASSVLAEQGEVEASPTSDEPRPIRLW